MPEVLGTSKSIYGFDPKSVQNLSIWFDAADTTSITTTSGSNITSWKNKGSIPLTAYPLTGGLATPVGGGTNSNAYGGFLTTGASVNGRNAVNCPQQTTYGMSSTVAFPTQARAVFAVYQAASAGASPYVVFFGCSTVVPNNQNGMMNYVKADGQGPVLFAEVGAGNGSVLGGGSPDGTFPYGTPGMIGWVQSATTTASNVITMNGAPSVISTNALATTYVTSGQYYFIGSSYTQAYIFCEYLMFNQEMTVVQRQAVEGYLARKWGITLPTTHPFYRIPPFTRYFNPVDIPGCQLWLDGMDPTMFTFSSGSNISSWNDKSGNANNANIVTATPPTYSSVTKSVVFAAASAMGLRGNMSSSVSNASVFIVSSYTSNAATVYSPRLFFLGSNNSTENFLIGQLNLMDQGLPAVVTYVGNLSGNAFGNANYQTGGNISYATPYIYTNISTYSGSTFTNLTLLNGAAGTYATKTGTMAVTPPSYVGTANRYAIGNSIFATPSANGDSYNGNVYEVIVYNTALTAGQRQQIEGYLSWKWSIGLNVITPTHSFYTFPPSALLPFYPTDISGCQMWLDSADASTITYASGVNISNWNDKSGSGNNAVVSGSAFATYTSNAVLFNNSLYTTPYSAVPINETAFIVFSTSNGATTNAALIGTSQNGARGIWAGYSGFTGGGVQAVGVVRAGEAWVAGSPANSVPNLTTTIATVTTTTNSATALNLNGSTTTYTGGASYTAGLTYLGRENSTSFGYIGYAMEIIFYNVVLSASQRQRVEGYLASKWNVALPSTHPYYEFGPTRISPPVPVGTVTVSLSTNVITATWAATSEAVSYTVSLFASSTSGGTYSISQGPFTTTAATYAFVVTVGNFYRAYVVVNGVLDSSATTISGFVQYVAAAWTPATALTTGAPLITWFKGDDGLTSTVWSNRGTNGGTATLTNASVATASQNGLNGVNFTAIPAYGTFTQTFSTQARACFAVVKFPTVSTTISQFLVAITNSWNFVLAASNPLQIMMIQQGVAVRVWSSNVPAMANNTAYVIGCVNSAVSTSSNAAIRNGTQYGLQINTLAANYPVSAQTTYLNYYNSANCNVPCFFYEVLCYSGEVAAADITNITGYLRTKWGTG